MATFNRCVLRVSWLLVILALLTFPASPATGSRLNAPAPPDAHIDIGGPVGSGRFGSAVFALPNGNIIVTDPYFDDGTTVDVGAVYLLDGSTGLIINWIHGSHTNDVVGFHVWVLKNGNYVITSTEWDNGSTANAGVATWCSGTTGCSGVVSPSNSLVGSHANDRVGYHITPLADGDYVVDSSQWNDWRGASTWCNGATGCIGIVDASNSLVGSTLDDTVGDSVWELTNGNYVVRSYSWDDGPIQDVGSVTWCSGSVGCTGAVSASNSLVGSSAGDIVSGAIPLDNGNYLVPTPGWDNAGATNAGAVTWCNGTTGCTGPISAANSLVGSTADDELGGMSSEVFMVANSNYVVAARNWDNGAIVDTGAVTWCDGTIGCIGTVTNANSLVGSTAQDHVGGHVTLLYNGSYVVSSSSWDNGPITDAGSVIWCHGYFGCQGIVTAGMGLAGSSANDWLGYYGVVDLNNGQYVVGSPFWDRGGAADAGAVTVCNGPLVACIGAPTEYNSLVGSQAGDRVGDTVTPLANGNYVASSIHWDNGLVVDAGAVTWCSVTTGCTGPVTSANSLVGATMNDDVGTVYSLNSGNYVVSTPFWDDGGLTDAGAVTWCSGSTGCAGSISFTNSLVGAHANDNVGTRVASLTNGSYVVVSKDWDDGVNTNVGAATWCSGGSGCHGSISTANSLVGSSVDDYIGSGGIIELKSGNYLVISKNWDNGAATDAGAISWCSGTGGCIGAVLSLNSLVGSQANDLIGFVSGGTSPVTVLDNGHYLVFSPNWDHTFLEDAGAVSLGNGFVNNYSGPITLENSVVGMVTPFGFNMKFTYDYSYGQLVVGRPDENVVSLFRGPYYNLFLPALKR